MAVSEIRYLLGRAREERRLADRARHPSAAASHRALAAAYMDRVRTAANIMGVAG